MQIVFDEIESGLERVAFIVHNMSIAHSEASSNKQASDINQCIQTAVSKFTKQSAGKMAKQINTELVLGKIPIVNIDTFKISQLLNHLLTNAYEAINQSGSITVCSKQQNGHIEISVADNGCGIEQKLQEIIFDPCFSTHKSAESTGLGLAISRAIATEHGGSLVVNSTPGKGAIFTLTMPALKFLVH
jgi:signal transduction histidine kinase